MNDSPTDSTRNDHTVSTQTLLIALGVVALIAAGLYFVGLNQGRKELAAQKTDYEQQVDERNQALSKSEAELAGVRNRNHLMHARVAIYRTAVDLDQRNFGIASGRLDEAADALGEIGNQSSGIDVARVTALKESIETSDFTVGADLESQRTRVLDFAAQLDSIAEDAN